MGKCIANYYRNNAVVTHKPLVCVGGFGSPACVHLKNCQAKHKKMPVIVRKLCENQMSWGL